MSANSCNVHIITIVDVIKNVCISLLMSLQEKCELACALLQKSRRSHYFEPLATWLLLFIIGSICDSTTYSRLDFMQRASLWPAPPATSEPAAHYVWGRNGTYPLFAFIISTCHGGGHPSPGTKCFTVNPLCNWHQCDISWHWITATSADGRSCKLMGVGVL